TASAICERAELPLHRNRTLFFIGRPQISACLYIRFSIYMQLAGRWTLFGVSRLPSSVFASSLKPQASSFQLNSLPPQIPQPLPDIQQAEQRTRNVSECRGQQNPAGILHILLVQ